MCYRALRGSSILPRPTIYLVNNDLISRIMEEKFNVFSTLADTTVFSGTKAECEDYKKKHENNDNSLYILSAK